MIRVRGPCGYWIVVDQRGMADAFRAGICALEWSFRRQRLRAPRMFMVTLSNHTMACGSRTRHGLGRSNDSPGRSQPGRPWRETSRWGPATSFPIPVECPRSQRSSVVELSLAYDRVIREVGPPRQHQSRVGVAASAQLSLDSRRWLQFQSVILPYPYDLYRLRQPCRNVEPWIGRRTTPCPVRGFSIAVHSRCNLACDYCYVYELTDQSWRGRPKWMSGDAAEAAGWRVAEQRQPHGLRQVFPDPPRW